MVLVGVELEALVSQPDALTYFFFFTLLLVGIASIQVETKTKIFNVKFRTSTKRKTVSQSEACVLANQKPKGVALSSRTACTQTLFVCKEWGGVSLM